MELTIHLLQDLGKLKGKLWEWESCGPGGCPTNQWSETAAKMWARCHCAEHLCLPSKCELTLPLSLFKSHVNLSCRQFSLATREGIYGKCRGNHRKSCLQRDPEYTAHTYTHVDTHIGVCLYVCVSAHKSVHFWYWSYDFFSQLVMNLFNFYLLWFSQFFSHNGFQSVMMRLGLLKVIFFL